MKIVLKKMKHAAFASNETECFQCAVFVDGKQMGTASNSGHGGPTVVSPDRLVEVLDLYASTLPPTDFASVCPDWVNDPRRYSPQTAETVIDRLVYEHFLAKRIAKQRRDDARRAGMQRAER